MRLLYASPFVLVLALFSPMAVSAHTWHVDQSGLGDFEVLQEALDAMASGDTIRIAPGRYDDWESYGPNWNVSKVRGYVNVEVATIIGSGSETIVGPEEPWDMSQGQTHGIEVSSVCSVLRLEQIAFEHLERAVMMGYGDSLSVAGCWFRDSKNAIAMGSRFASIAGCEITGILAPGYGVISYFQDRVILQRCSSTSELEGINVHFQVEGPSEVTINECQFVGASGGVRLSRGPMATISRSEFSGQSRWGVALELNPTCIIADCVFRDQRKAMIGSVSPGSVLRVDRVVVESVGHSTLNALYLQDGYIHHSQLAAGTHGVVSNQQYGAASARSENESPTRFDMRSNWWGTADPDSIAGLILDHNDNADVHYLIDFEPFLEGPVGLERRNMSEIKSLFR